MSEEKKYAVLMPISIQRCAESRGIDDLSDEVAEALAEDTSYRIREIVNTSTQFMRHARRNCLTAKDVAKALKISDVPPTLGLDHSESPTFEYIEEEDIHFLKEDLIDLQTLALDDVEENEVKEPYFTSEWFLLDGQLLSSEGGRHGTEGLSSTLLEYFNYIVTCILGEDKELRQVSFSDLRKNCKIAPLIPYFVNFVSNVNAVSHDLEQLSNLLQTVSALTMNPYLSLLGYLKPFITAVLYCVLEPLTASINPANDHWLLRDYGARLLAYVAEKYSSTNADVVKYIKESVKNILSDPTRPLCSHYGAIVTINALGVDAIRAMLCPDLADYYGTLLRIVEEETDCDNVHLKEDAHKVVGAILQGLETLYTDALEGVITKSDCKIFTDLFSIFNGSIEARLPLYPKKWQASPFWLDNFGAPTHSTALPIDVNSVGQRFWFFTEKHDTRVSKRRRRFTSISEVFRPYRPCRRKMRISIGAFSQPMDADDSYVHSSFFSLNLKVSYIGKRRHVVKMRGKPPLNNYLALTL